MAAACIFPLILVISISFSDQEAIARFGYRLIPDKFSIDAYKYVLASGSGIGHAYLVTILSTVSGTFLSVLVIAMYAYPLSREGLKYKGFFTFYIFFTMLFSGGLVAWYMVVTRVLCLGNTIWALILPLTMSAWYVIIMRTFFQTSIPASLIESARLDGAGAFTVLIKIVFPLALPAVATIALFQTLAYWNDWWNPMLLITDKNLYNLQFLLQVMMKNIQMLSEESMSADAVTQIAENIPQESVRMALCVVAMGPILIVYPFFQKYFIQGLTIGAVKG
ncbi:MAG: carbohydrate ABC transporter permease [Clostridia bacterium]|nr:carbohydrate ABC transporter permease [Clostridia bacterium]